MPVRDSSNSFPPCISLCNQLKCHRVGVWKQLFIYLSLHLTATTCIVSAQQYFSRSHEASLTEAAKPVNTVLYLYEQDEPTLVSWEHRVVTSLNPAVLFKRITYLHDTVHEDTHCSSVCCLLIGYAHELESSSCSCLP